MGARTDKPETRQELAKPALFPPPFSSIMPLPTFVIFIWQHHKSRSGPRSERFRPSRFFVSRPFNKYTSKPAPAFYLLQQGSGSVKVFAKDLEAARRKEAVWHADSSGTDGWVHTESMLFKTLS